MGFLNSLVLCEEWKQKVVLALVISTTESYKGSE